MQDLMKQLEQFIKETENYLTEAVKEMLEQEIPILSEEKFALFETTGNRLIYEQDYFAKRRFLTVFGVAAWWMTQERLDTLGDTTKQAVLMKLEQILFSICEEECWALPAHVNRKENSDWRNTIDLFAAETAQTLADLADNINLSGQCRIVVLENVQRRVLIPFFTSEAGAYGWEKSDNNWNAVCNGCIGSAYLHSLPKGNAFEPNMIRRITDNLLNYIAGFAADGTCMEGLGYYFYGMTYMVNFAKELYQYSEGTIDLLQGDWGSFQAGEQDKRTEIATWWRKCFFVGGRTVSFSDASPIEKYRMGLACILAVDFQKMFFPEVSRALTLEEDACYRYVPFKMDFYETKDCLKQLRERHQVDWSGCQFTNIQQSRCSILQDAQWCIGEAALRKVGFACKGGHNDEPHNHNDVGSFIYVGNQEMFLADLGAGEYTKAYFGEGRYNILCNRSLGHNIPLIDGKEQLTGRVYKCNGFEAVEEETQISISMELKDAYESHGLERFTRKLTFEKEDGGLIIEDFFEACEEIKVTENLVTKYPPRLQGNSILLAGKSGICQLQIVTAGEQETERLRVVPMEHKNHEGKAETVYLIQWDIVIKDSHRECVKIEFI